MLPCHARSCLFFGCIHIAFLHSGSCTSDGVSELTLYDCPLSFTYSPPTLKTGLKNREILAVNVLYLYILRKKGLSHEQHDQIFEAIASFNDHEMSTFAAAVESHLTSKLFNIPLSIIWDSIHDSISSHQSHYRCIYGNYLQLR